MLDVEGELAVLHLLAAVEAELAGHLLAVLHLLAFLAVLGAARLEAELAVLDVDAVAGDGIAVEAVDALAVEGELAVLAGHLLHLLAAVGLDVAGGGEARGRRGGARRD